MQESLLFNKDIEENTNSTLTIYDHDDSRLSELNISDLEQSLNIKHHSMSCHQSD
jgi:hypothetical protein